MFGSGLHAVWTKIGQVPGKKNCVLNLVFRLEGTWRLGYGIMRSWTTCCDKVPRITPAQDRKTLISLWSLQSGKAEMWAKLEPIQAWRCKALTPSAFASVRSKWYQKVIKSWPQAAHSRRGRSYRRVLKSISMGHSKPFPIVTFQVSSPSAPWQVGIDTRGPSWYKLAPYDTLRLAIPCRAFFTEGCCEAFLPLTIKTAVLLFQMLISGWRTHADPTYFIYWFPGAVCCAQIMTYPCLATLWSVGAKLSQ